jgi:PBSX family phage terminase large subunit
MKTTDIEVLDSQLEFLQDTSPQLLLSGSYGSGKTRVLCLKAAIVASHPGARVLLCRKELSALQASTLKSLLETDGNLPPILPPGSYEHEKAKHVIKIKNGGEIYYTGFDSSVKILSMNVSFVAIDEGIELEQSKQWNDLASRLRLKVKGVQPQIATATNPGSPAHFLYKLFINPLTRKDNTKVIYSSVYENHFLLEKHPNYIKDFCPNENDYIGYQRYVLGKWVSAEGLVYKGWNPEKMITDYDKPYLQRTVAGIDWGYAQPSCIMVIGINPENKRLKILDEYYQKGISEQELTNKVKEMDDKYHFEYVAYDHANSQLGDVLNRNGLPVEKADKSIIEGIGTVNHYMRIDNGTPCLTVSPRCENFAREIVGYCWDEKKDKPIKGNDHSLDATRYGIVLADQLINYGDCLVNLGNLY